MCGWTGRFAVANLSKVDRYADAWHCISHVTHDGMLSPIEGEEVKEEEDRDRKRNTMHQNLASQCLQIRGDEN